MKRIIFIVLTVLAFSAFAEFRPAKRYVELGVNVNANASENLIPVLDVLQKDLVLDFSKIYSDMGKNGFVLSAGASAEAYLDFNFKKFGIGFHGGAEVSSRFNISKDLFGLVAEGFEAGTPKNIEINSWVQTFATFSMPFYFRIKNLKLRFTPTYFLPLVYVPSVPAKIVVDHKEDGTTSINANASVDVYTINKFDGLVKDGKFSFDFLNGMDYLGLTKNLLACGGFDLGIGIEYPLSKKLDVGGYANIPILPGRMKGKVNMNLEANVEMPSLLDMAFGSDKIDKSWSMSDLEYTDASYKVSRPLRCGLELAYHPWKNWMTLSAAVGFGLRNPYGKDFSKANFYPEYDLGAEFIIFYFLGLGIHTEYTQQVFAHTFQLILNAKIIQVDVAVGLASSDFIKSFKIEGARARFGFKMGW